MVYSIEKKGKRMKVSEVQVVPIKPKNGLVGFASCVIDESIFIGSIGIFTRPNGGYRLTYPTKKVGLASQSIIHPINKLAADLIDKAIISQFEEVTKTYVRYSSSDSK